MVSMPLVGAISTDKVYVGETGLIGGYPTYDYDAYRWGDYIVWVRALDIYDNSGNVNPDGDVTDRFDPSWVMIHQISTGESWNITPDYDAGLFISPNQYHHAQAVSIWGGKVLYEYVYGDDDWERTLYMYNITTEEYWNIPHGSLTSHTSGHTHQIYGDWICFTTYGGGGRTIYVMNYKTSEGRRIDDGEVSNTAIGMDEDFVWFTATAGSPDILLIHGLVNDVVTAISGEHIGASIYAGRKSSNGLLGIRIVQGGNSDSYIIDMEALNITDEGGDKTIYWEDIPDDALIEVDTESYDSYAPLTDGNYAIYNYDNAERDIMIYDIDSEQKTYFATSSNDEVLSDYYNTMIIYRTNINSFVHNNDARDDYDIYRSVSDTEFIGESITAIVPIVIIILITGAILGAFKLFGSGGTGGMI